MLFFWLFPLHTLNYIKLISIVPLMRFMRKQSENTITIEKCGLIPDIIFGSLLPVNKTREKPYPITTTPTKKNERLS